MQRNWKCLESLNIVSPGGDFGVFKREQGFSVEPQYLFGRTSICN